MAITLTTGQVTAAADNLGKLIIDANALINPATSGLVTDLTTEVTRIQALTDSIVNPTLGQAWYIEQQTAVQQGTPAGKLISWLAAVTYANLIASNGPFYAWDALDYVCSLSTTGGANTGLASFLVNNALVVDQYSADSFNAWVNAVNNGSYLRRYGTLAAVAIASAQVFPHANVDYVNQYAATGATTGNLTTGTQTLIGAKTSGGNTAPGGGILECYCSGSIGASSYTITVTYTKNDGTAGQTMTFSITANATNNTVFTPSGSNDVGSIQSVAVTSGSATSGDILRFRLKPVRAITA